MKGIVLAGGVGSRLHPITNGIPKQLLPVYDKPMIYYPLATLMQAGIRDILIISSPQDLPLYQRALGAGERFGICLEYAEQKKPEGIAQAFLIAEKFIAGQPVCLILGDNIFHGSGLVSALSNAANIEQGAVVFAAWVKDPERFGVFSLDDEGRVSAVTEKPTQPDSSYAVSGLYFYDKTVCDKARAIKPSARGELEITDINNLYLSGQQLNVERLEKGFAWFDAGTHDSLLEASLYIQSVQKRTGLIVACLEEIALTNGWVTVDHLANWASQQGQTTYVQYVQKLGQ